MCGRWRGLRLVEWETEAVWRPVEIQLARGEEPVRCRGSLERSAPSLSGGLVVDGSCGGGDPLLLLGRGVGVPLLLLGRGVGVPLLLGCRVGVPLLLGLRCGVAVPLGLDRSVGLGVGPCLGGGVGAGRWVGPLAGVVDPLSVVLGGRRGSPVAALRLLLYWWVVLGVGADDGCGGGGDVVTGRLETVLAGCVRDGASLACRVHVAVGSMPRAVCVTLLLELYTVLLLVCGAELAISLQVALLSQDGGELRVPVVGLGRSQGC